MENIEPRVVEIDDEENYTNDDIQVDEYDLTSTPNDFNIITISNFIDSGAIIIPAFQRNYVWDIKRASKLIESIILGLPVPQVFLYEEDRNKFLIIDGQQRLMTIYYFIKQRFPKKEKRTELRKILIEKGEIPDEILFNDEYFMPFKLRLPEVGEKVKNKFNNLTYKTLADFRIQFELRPLRNIIVRQNSPKNDTSSVYEIFNRLNSGGMNLRPQEIRSSLFHSEFMNYIHTLNLTPQWRKILGTDVPDLHMKDVELLFRCIAFMRIGDEYSPSLAKFLNDFAKQTRRLSLEDLESLKIEISKVFNVLENIDVANFINEKTNRVNTLLLESIFYYIGNKAKNSVLIDDHSITSDKINKLKNDSTYIEVTSEATTNTENVKKRFQSTLRIFDNG